MLTREEALRQAPLAGVEIQPGLYQAERFQTNSNCVFLQMTELLLAGWMAGRAAPYGVFTADCAEADIVVVPLAVQVCERKPSKNILARFAEARYELLPYLRAKPHFLLLNRVLVDYSSGLFDSPAETEDDNDRFWCDFVTFTVEPELTDDASDEDAEYTDDDYDESTVSLKSESKSRSCQRYRRAARVVQVPYTTHTRLLPSLSTATATATATAAAAIAAADGEILNYSHLLHQRRPIFAALVCNLKTPLRRQLAKHCNERSQLCRVEEFSTVSAMISLYNMSEFCIQPPGDTPTRGSFFEGIFWGCIPVVFDPPNFPLPFDRGLYSDVNASENNTNDDIDDNNNKNNINDNNNNYNNNNNNNNNNFNDDIFSVDQEEYSKNSTHRRFKILPQDKEYVLGIKWRQFVVVLPNPNTDDNRFGNLWNFDSKNVVDQLEKYRPRIRRMRQALVEARGRLLYSAARSSRQGEQPGEQKGEILNADENEIAIERGAEFMAWMEGIRVVLKSR